MPKNMIYRYIFIVKPNIIIIFVEINTTTIYGILFKHI